MRNDPIHIDPIPNVNYIVNYSFSNGKQHSYVYNNNHNNNSNYEDNLLTNFKSKLHSLLNNPSLNLNKLTTTNSSISKH